MYKLSPRRNQRSHGFKVKHAFQICLLGGVCIWLLYQVQSKKSSYEVITRDSKKMARNHMKLGRKDLDPRIAEMTTEDLKNGGQDPEEDKSFDDDDDDDKKSLEIGQDQEKPEEEDEAQSSPENGRTMEEQQQEHNHTSTQSVGYNEVPNQDISGVDSVGSGEKINPSNDNDETTDENSSRDEESSSDSTGINLNDVQHEPSSSILQAEIDSHTDLDTMPQTEFEENHHQATE